MSPTHDWPAALPQWIEVHWGAWTGGRSRPGSVLALRARKPGRVTLLIAAVGAGSPAVAVKVATEQEDRHRLDDEFAALTRLRGQAAGQEDVMIPTVLGHRRLSGAAVLATEVVPGRRLASPRLDRPGPVERRALRRYISTVGALSEGLAARFPRTRVGDGRALPGLVDAFAETTSDSRASALARSFATALRAHLPMVPGAWQHGDPAVGNILVDGRRAAFIDWETARPDHPPWLDLASAPLALLHAAASQRRRPVTAGLLSGTLGDTAPAGQVMRSELRARWHHDLPLGWALVLAAIHLGMGRALAGGSPVPHGMAVAEALLADDQCRRTVRWAAPDW